MFKLKFLKVVTAILVLAATSSFAQDEITSLTTSNFNEIIDGVWEVNSTPVLGFTYYDEQDVIDPRHIYVHIPSRKNRARVLTLHMTSADARYVARSKVTVPANFSGWAHIPYKGTRAEKIRQLEVSTFGIIVSDGNDAIFATRWGQPILSDNAILLINSGRSKAYLLEVDERGDRHKADCEAAESASNHHIDSICHISLQHFIRDDNSIRIRRRSGRGFKDPIILNLGY